MLKDIKLNDKVRNVRQEGMQPLDPYKVFTIVHIKGEYPNRKFTLNGEDGEIRMIFENLGDMFQLVEVPEPEVKDMVDHPEHYTQGGTIECIDYIESFLSKEEYIGYLRGNIAKYLHRWRYKNKEEDLKKAQWYLARLADFMEDQDN